MKLKLQHEISSYAVGLGEFLVLFPFTKKDKQQTERMEESAGPSKEPNPNESSVNNLAESAWSELMQDLSALHDISSNENLPNVELNSTNVEDTHAEVTISRTKRKRVPNRDKKEGPLDDLLSNMLQKSSNEILDKQNCKVFIEVLESSCCLNDPRLGICVMREASDILDNETDPSTSNSSSCICPPWLKDIIMAFSFSNIYSAWLQFRQEKITISALQGALDQLHRFGFRPGITELENLSELCPQVTIRLVNYIIISFPYLISQPDGFSAIFFTKILSVSKLIVLIMYFMYSSVLSFISKNKRSMFYVTKHCGHILRQ